MTETYFYREDWNCVLLKSIGSRSIEDYRKMVSALKEDSRVRPNYLRLSDFRSVDELPSAEATRTIAAIIGELEAVKPVSRVAIVAREDIHYGMIRIYQAYQVVPEEKLRVFRTLPEAYQWLDIPEDRLDPFAPEIWVPDWQSDAP